jgi:hypothetical protein
MLHIGTLALLFSALVMVEVLIHSGSKDIKSKYHAGRFELLYKDIDDMTRAYMQMQMNMYKDSPAFPVSLHPLTTN